MWMQYIYSIIMYTHSSIFSLQQRQSYDQIKCIAQFRCYLGCISLIWHIIVWILNHYQPVYVITSHLNKKRIVFIWPVQCNSTYAIFQCVLDILVASSICLRVCWLWLRRCSFCCSQVFNKFDVLQLCLILECTELPANLLHISP